MKYSAIPCFAIYLLSTERMRLQIRNVQIEKKDNIQETNAVSVVKKESKNSSIISTN